LCVTECAAIFHAPSVSLRHTQRYVPPSTALPDARSTWRHVPASNQSPSEALADDGSSSSVMRADRRVIAGPMTAPPVINWPVNGRNTASDGYRLGTAPAPCPL